MRQAQNALPRKRPELLLAAAALLICAGVLVVTGAGGGKGTAAASPTTRPPALNPFERNEQAAQTSVTDAAGSYVVGYTGVIVYSPPETETLPVDTAPADTGQPAAFTEPPMEYAQPPTQPTATAPQATAAPQVPTAPPQVGPVNINTASQAQLETLPGIGPVKAQAILEWRAAHGVFTDVNQLLEVKGIGEKTLANLLPYITI